MRGSRPPESRSHELALLAPCRRNARFMPVPGASEDLTNEAPRTPAGRTRLTGRIRPTLV